MSSFTYDLKYSFRMLAKSRGFTCMVILIMGLGVGANTAIFNALDQVALRPLPVKNPEELVSIQYETRDGPDGVTNYPIYEAYRDQSNVFTDLIAFGYGDGRWFADNEMRTIKELGVTANYFSMLGVRPALGRLFNEKQEPDTQEQPVVIISHRFWQQHFTGKPEVIGKQLQIDERMLTIIGVAPSEFQGTVIGWAPDVYVPAGLQARMGNMELMSTRSIWLYLLGRLKPGVSRKQAQVSLDVLANHLRSSGQHHAHAQVSILDGSRGWTAWETRDLPQPLILFLIVALLVLAIAIVNIASIQLSRAASRQKEIAIRQALGSGRWLVVRQLLIESLLLALAGGLCGFVFALWLDRILCILIGRIGQVTMVPGLNLRVLGYGLGISLIAGFVFGLAPASQILRRNVTPALKESGDCVELSRRRWNPHHLLATAQVAMAVTLLTCAGLFVRSMVILNRIDPGYDTSKLIGVSIKHVWLKGEQPDLRQFYYNLHERVRNLPGVEASCLSNLVPLGESGSMRTVSHVNGMEIPKEKQRSWWYVAASPDYFKVVNMPLLKGRLLTEQDNLHAPKVMVVNDIMAKTHWPDKDPIGQTVTFSGRRDPITLTIVGIVKATKMRSIVEGQRPIAYWPLAQIPRFIPQLLMRTTGNPQPFIPLIREEVAALGPQEVCHISTIADRVSALLYPQRAITNILSLFALAGLLLCVMGIYSVMAYGVKQRTREIGIRMALGAEERHVIKTILFKGGRIALTGIALGLGLSMATIRLMEVLLPGLQNWNKFMLHSVDLWSPSNFVVVPLLVICVALAACYVPARRAAKIDPMEALRYE
ncbi:ABC transporter permease [Planctomycetota bacterium]